MNYEEYHRLEEEARRERVMTNCLHCGRRFRRGVHYDSCPHALIPPSDLAKAAEVMKTRREAGNAARTGGEELKR